MTITMAAQQDELQDAVDGSIVDLRNGRADTSFKSDILAGLQKTARIVPGDREEDQAWAYSKTIPTRESASRARTNPPLTIPRRRSSGLV